MLEAILVGPLPPEKGGSSKSARSGLVELFQDKMAAREEEAQHEETELLVAATEQSNLDQDLYLQHRLATESPTKQPEEAAATHTTPGSVPPYSAEQICLIRTTCSSVLCGAYVQP